jgi:hypothetical protein
MPQTVRIALLASLLALSASAATAAQDTPTKAPPAVDQPTILVTSVVPGFVAKDGIINGAVVQFDLLNGDLQKALSGQSTRLVIDIDCGGEKIRARNMIVYKEPKQGGAAAEVRIKDDWESYHGGAYLADVARSICHQDGGPKLAVTATPLKSSNLVANSPMPGAAQVRSGRSAIQFVSSTSQAEVETDISKIKASVGDVAAGLQFTVQSAVVKGVKHYRGRVTGFGSVADAAGFCTKVVELKLPCLIVKPDGPSR